MRAVPIRIFRGLFSRIKNLYGFEASGNSGLFSFKSTSNIVRKRNVSNDDGVP